ncbi:M23 family metallopeptidase [Truepera radiovictrix]|uniref:Peptidase M23 n=1 Tax=Truepera radiovictrix (strain DSM 17093 / CIP 108686 / LMG 22925 / RQ-24) TaxID=649638 RepID=D7CUD3_TRURR|nr:M23 family metallopeptidase [Truepera radiovictrix]ADI15718.1 Peptidase M23 [Truepera radiovictrix DSM 17093]WMT58656.1 M23 family metallopeptidase [Truepera radiovictrix]
MARLSRRVARPLALAALFGALAPAQQPPQVAGLPPLEALPPLVCPDPPEGGRDADRAPEERERRRAYRALLPLFLAALPEARDTELLMPVFGARVAHVADTWGAPRGGGRVHEGQDIFAPEGTPVYSATYGFVYRIGENDLGGNVVTVIGGAGVRYYYAHLSAFAEGLTEGQAVTPETLLGFVGRTGNASGTPPHLHLGMYTGLCDWEAEDPLPLLVDRDWQAGLDD